MKTFDWKPFLEKWSRAVLESPEVEHFDLPPEMIQSGWLGLPGATDEQIAAAEARLGVRLPPSYRSFLRVTNGWQHTGLRGRLLPVEALDRFDVLHPEWLDAWMSGFTSFGEQPYEYKPEFDEVDYRHLPKTLAISEADDLEILLLNPEVVSSDGEWEAWSFVDDGAGRYETFWHLLQSEYDVLKQVSRALAQQLRPSDPPDAVVTKLPGLIAALEEKLATARSLAAKNDMGIEKGTVDGLEVAITRVRKLQGITDPSRLRKNLEALAANLTAEAAQMEAPLKNLVGESIDLLLKPVPNLFAMLSRLGPMMKGLRTAGKAMGLRSGADVIRWYLGNR
ncbi:MAG: SMI1/KNR4 family protein [Anaerolineae bacterium]|nr:SMI1/KNR4 family protein [Anaerolineae bacterium]